MQQGRIRNAYGVLGLYGATNGTGAIGAGSIANGVFNLINPRINQNTIASSANSNHTIREADFSLDRVIPTGDDFAGTNISGCFIRRIN